MAIATDKCIFLHIPKTGGMWVKYALSVAGIPFYEIGQQHEYFPLIRNHQSPEFFENKLVFTMVRHPILWYQSRWAFRIKHGWQARHPLDWACASNDFHKFVNNVFDFAPHGWCNWLFKQYCEIDRVEIDFIGRTEFLVDDFLKAMKLAGHEVDEQDIRRTAVINSSSMDQIGSKDWAKYSPQLYDRVMTLESSVINRFYHDYQIDPNTLIGPRPY